MRLTKKNIKTEILKLFVECDHTFISVDEYAVEVSVWGLHGMNQGDKLKEIIKILQIIDNTDLIESSWDVWRRAMYYDDTDDIYMQFKINRDLLKDL